MILRILLLSLLAFPQLSRPGTIETDLLIVGAD